MVLIDWWIANGR